MSNYINQQFEHNEFVDSPGYILGANYYPTYNPNEAKYLTQVNACISPYKTPQEIDSCVLNIHSNMNKKVQNIISTSFEDPKTSFTEANKDPRYNPDSLYVGNIKGLSERLCLNKNDPRSVRECLSNVGLGMTIPIRIATRSSYPYSNLSQQYESSRDTL